ncbi:tRNA lysidine(34) synthetase TilS [Parvularcula sp. LCG005]|uniref:tRNA lysidine(34) synthetase TilS n=1 Tax=Parvularcula sp. LCG005 TaxID=3078805 RepID=UPI002942D21A|nr:tRNA lysidine(34) synthetase TilS [Parvularcula sp. LCG005]WOI54242.1 tRNA lysidine(34) synthetase TilS [Parvularcula sp. LCG005]
MPVDPASPFTLDPAGLPAEPDALIGVAISGGADSFALLDQLHRAGRKILALTVDHGLRSESTAEAAVVAAFCASRSIDHRTLVWEAEKPKTGVLSAAREARYRLLIKACSDAGIDWLVTAHTRDDQAETVMMRLRRGSGAGLAGMRVTERVAAGAGRPITLGRPLLTTARRSDTQLYAQARSLPVQSDPSNLDEKYERIGIRGLLAGLDVQGILHVEALERSAQAIAALAGADDRLTQRDGEAAGWMIGPDAVLRIAHPERAEDLPRLIARAMEIVVGRGPVPADFVTEDRLSAGRFTGQGAEVILNDDGCTVLREPAALLGRADLERTVWTRPVTPEPFVFDNRFRLVGEANVPDGSRWAIIGQCFPVEFVKDHVERRVISTMPCIISEKGVLTHVPTGCDTIVLSALQSWRGAAETLSELELCDADILLSERFKPRVIRY